MGDGGVGLATRDIAIMRANRRATIAPGAAGAETTTRSLLASPAAPPAANGTNADTSGIYSLRGVYFSLDQFSSTADCLTAASAQGLPLELCH
jgi:hypothetical protein